MRDFTARLRDELLRQDREERGRQDYPQAEDAGGGDWTAQLLKARRVLEDPGATDEQRKVASDWLRAHSGTCQGLLTWDGA
jgi:hypothetical protein